MFRASFVFFLFAAAASGCSGDGGNKTDNNGPSSQKSPPSAASARTSDKPPPPAPGPETNEYTERCRKIYEEAEKCVQALDVSPLLGGGAVFADDRENCKRAAGERLFALLEGGTDKERLQAKIRERSRENGAAIEASEKACSTNQTPQRQRDCQMQAFKIQAGIICAPL